MDVQIANSEWFMIKRRWESTSKKELKEFLLWAWICPIVLNLEWLSDLRYTVQPLSASYDILGGNTAFKTGSAVKNTFMLRGSYYFN